MNQETYDSGKNYGGKPVSEIGPPSTHEAATPSDTLAYDRPIREVRVGTAGDVALRMQDGTIVVYKNCYAGEYICGNFVQIMETDTSASDLVARR